MRANFFKSGLFLIFFCSASLSFANPQSLFSLVSLDPEKLDRPVLARAFQSLALEYQTTLKRVLFEENHQLSEREQSELLKLASGVFLYTPIAHDLTAKVMARAVSRLSSTSFSEKNFENLKWEIGLILWEAPARKDSLFQTLEKAFQTAQDLGFAIPFAPRQFVQNQIVLEATLEHMQSTLIATAPAGGIEAEILSWDLKKTHEKVLKRVGKDPALLANACLRMLQTL